MAKVESIAIPDELKNQYNATLQVRDRFELGVVQGQAAPLSDTQRKRARGQSLFSFFSVLWRAMSEEDKQAWKDAAPYSNLSGWQLFVSDNAARLKASLPLEVPPSELWQVRAGQILIEDPATEIILKQEHPLDYWVSQKVRGQSWKNTLVLLREEFSLPLTLEIRYKSDLTAVGGTQKAKYYARIWSTYQGRDIYTDFGIDFDPSTDWTFATIDYFDVIGKLKGYTLYMEVVGYQGELLFDNIRAVHSGTNWARDPRCDDISKTFTKAFAVVPPFWVPVSLPQGSTFTSQFPPAL